MHICTDLDQSNWVLNLLLAELVYNLTYYDFIEMSLFMATYRFKLSTNLDTELLPKLMPTVNEWINQITNNHILVKLQLKWTTDQMKWYTDCKQCHVELQVGGQVFLNHLNISSR